MNESTLQNKKAWEYRAYEFWRMSNGAPEEKARKISEDPKACLRYHRKYFEHIEGMNIANPCGSNGRIAVPLSLLGANVTVFDISEENRRYAVELAQCAGVSVEYVVGDFFDIDLITYNEYFDIAYLEGGILHYFHDIRRLADILYRILRKEGKLILSDFHPFRKVMPSSFGKQADAVRGNYFDCGVYDGSVAYRNFFPREEQESFPPCSLRFYTISEILNSFIAAGFAVREFLEHPNWEDGRIPGEFTLYAIK